MRKESFPRFPPLRACVGSTSAAWERSAPAAKSGRRSTGGRLLSYVGHGGIHLWASENILDVSNVPNLTPQALQPLVLTLNCLNGYFHFPYGSSLAEALVEAPGKGAIAAFSPTGLSLDEPAHLFHQAIVSELSSGRYLRLGDAIAAAQARYASTGAFPELLSIYHLLGDPALKLN